VIEFGCGDGNQLSLADYPAYIGLDVSETAIKLCIQRFVGDRTKSFFLYDPHCFSDPTGALRADVAISLDVLFHLVDDSLFGLHLRHLFGAGARFVVICSSNAAFPDAAAHVRHRTFTDTVASGFPAWRLIEHIANPVPYNGNYKETSPSDFFVYGRGVDDLT